jgi:two-component system sensor histidine kinase KdpD
MVRTLAGWVVAGGPRLRYAVALGACLVATGIVAMLPHALWLASGALIYLLAVLGVSVLAGRGPGIAASLVSFAALDFLFVDPRFTLAISDPNEWTALLTLLVVSVVSSQLAAGQRDRVVEAEAREREARVLHDLTDLLASGDLGDALQSVAEQLRVELSAEAVTISVAAHDLVSARVEAGTESGRTSLRALPGPMHVLAEGHPASAGRSGEPGRWLRVRPAHRPEGSLPRNVARAPVRRGAEPLGEVLVLWETSVQPGVPQARLLDTVAGQIAVASEREVLRARALEAEVLRRTSDLKSALLDAVSHDLRTPLSSIIAGAQSLLQTDVAWSVTERRELLETIEEEAERLNRIVGNLLDLSRLQAGSLIPARDWHDAGLLLRETLYRMAPVTREHRLTVEVPDDLPPVYLDPVEIDQVVTNLVENAVKFTPPGGEITVHAAVRDGELQVSVQDSGPGLATSALPRLFEPFYRASGTRATGGSGVGLAVARGLVTAHGGRIWAQNANGRGARFTFAIPAASLEKDPLP